MQGDQLRGPFEGGGDGEGGGDTKRGGRSRGET